MLGFLKNHTYPIGVDLGNDALKLAQLGSNGSNGSNVNAVSLIVGSSESRPAYIQAGSSDWQRWAVEAIRKMMTTYKFKGRDVVAAMPAGDVFIDHMKMPKTSEDKLQEAIFSKIKQKLPFDSVNAMTKYIPTEGNSVLVLAAEREKIDRHLAIYEKAQLSIKSIGVWPIALTNSYVSFFGRRKDDVDVVVMLLEIEQNSTNIVICRHKNLLFARSIPIGAREIEKSDEDDETPSQLQTDEMVNRLIMELTACRRHFSTMHKKARIERAIFLSGQTVSQDVCTTIAQQLEMPAHVGDCLAAVEMADPDNSGLDRRGFKVNWATAFGLSLS
jgi:Tfp pilus assembly PilM family ATPase